MNTTTTVQQWAEDLSNKNDDCKIKALAEALSAVSHGSDLRQLVPSVAKITSTSKTTNLELVSLVYLFLTYVARSDPQALLLAVNALELGATKGGTPMIREQAIRTLGEISTPDIISDIAEFVIQTTKDEHAYVRSAAAVCISNLFRLDAEKAEKANLLAAVEDMLEDQSIDVAITAIKCLSQIKKDGNLVEKCPALLDRIHTASTWNILLFLEVMEAYDITDVELAKSVIERLFLLVQHADNSIVMAALRVMLRTIDPLPDKRIRERMVSKLIPTLVTLTLSDTFELKYVILRSLPVLIRTYPDLFNSTIQYFVPCYTDNKVIKFCKLRLLYCAATNTSAKSIIISLGNWVLDETLPSVTQKCIQTLSKIAAKLDLFIERILNILRSILRKMIGGVAGRQDSQIETFADILDTDVAVSLQHRSVVVSADGRGIASLGEPLFSRIVQTAIEETVIQLEYLLPLYPDSVLDVLPFFEPLLYLVRTEQSVVSALGILTQYSYKKLRSMDTFLIKLGRGINLSAYSPSFQLFFLQLLMQRYFRAVSGDDEICDGYDGPKAQASDASDAAASSGATAAEVSAILDSAFSSLLSGENDTVVQAQATFYYNMYTMVKQKAHGDANAADFRDTLVALRPVLFHDIRDLKRAAATAADHSPRDVSGASDVRSPLSPSSSPRQLQSRYTGKNGRGEVHLYRIGNVSTVIENEVDTCN